MSEPVGTLNDAALVRAAQAGDIAGLGALLERHRSRLHAIAVSILGHGPQAEDAVQDTFLIALRRIGELRDPAAARAWLPRPRQRLPRGAAPARGRVEREPLGPAGPRHRAHAIDAARSATGCGPRSSACPSRCASRSCCATSRARARMRRSPTSAAFPSAPSAAA